ncbi:hypothetical protein [Dongia sp.]|uniref:hypothetical protein n=1 Tax=Dongia sp. TaxID=1977262 RepID=UPI0037526ACB
MDRSNRKDNRVPHGLSFLMWPALLRAPWLIGDVMGDGNDDRLEAERRRRRAR